MELVQHPDVTAQVTWVVSGRPITRKYSLKFTLRVENLSTMHFEIQIFRQQIGSNCIGRFEKSADKIEVVYWWMEVLSKNRGLEK